MMGWDAACDFICCAARMDLEYREGIACMNVGLLFFPSSLLLFSWDTLTTFASHTISVSYDILARVAPLKATGLLFCIPGHLRAGTSGG